MTTEEVKKYLKQAYKLDQRLKRERRNLEKLQSSAEYRSPNFEGGGGSGGGDRMSESVSRIMEKEKRVRELTDIYTRKYIEIENTIHSVGDDVLEEVLELRYLHYMLWEDIAEKMHRDLRWIYRLHGKALAKIKLTIESHVLSMLLLQ